MSKMATRVQKIRHKIENEFSGGVKLIELSTELIMDGWYDDEIIELEEYIKAHPNCGLKVLNYVWKAGGNREKSFIYESE